MDYKQTAKEIVAALGGKDNISLLNHCSTRLRITLKNDNKADSAALEKIDGVLGVRKNVQYQIIIGNDVVEVYQEVNNIVGNISNEDTQDGPAQKRSIGSTVLDFIIAVFQPLVPAIAGGGVLKSILLLLAAIGVMDDGSTTYQILDNVGTAPLYFLPILVAVTSANKLKVNPLVAISAVGALLLPGMSELIADGANFLSFNIQEIDYSSQVFPAILTVLFYAQMEKGFNKITPKSIRVFFVPMMSLLLTVPISLLILGPLGYNFGTLFSSAIIWLYGHFGWVATGILAGILPFMVVTGMHKAMIPYAISSMGELGKESLYMPASLAHNLAESGACFAVALRTKDKKLKPTAISAGISALFGITEPALYGVTVLHKKVLYSVILASIIGGSFSGIMILEAFAIVGPGLASITMFIDPQNAMNIVWAFATLGISFVAAFIFAIILYKDETTTEEENNEVINETKDVILESPVKGRVLPLTEVKDDVFSSGLVGDGIAVEPTEGKLTAPVAGEVTMIFETNHALGLKTDNGAELLLHIGVDTVKMDGVGFQAFVKQGDRVEQGQQLITFDIDKIKNEGFESTVICVVTNNNFEVKPSIDQGNVSFEDPLLTVSQLA
ncbi:beta-glucoside-specific PTS transporter subunit IIABC [Tetragenococcus koreensis]|uniref:PTS system sucrose-specific EIIBCA component n=1 Tax=Tetragenococcus koreensis TaxID=290335 RepID=A0AAN4UDS7_9ENTE|nr:beta-glucoside-specific PTS transporter subunit IIABC [Tetragenococcus koreensis]MCF1585627.1 beta-glucoside-specific PTS transporter subunit IIABC [Tetragenococcus koreensis]MCF1615177.1 beta-glucoside-specific PTS transporter subunit IIABC [Tetragenococcus koreensis]MCF1617884.1 beta-glucoside-specific PTS transporter subunit IIABC [Tetragenococcus koreensis]MCF1620208.1 beta-glucoside-specific PTS transporter subunit IIABC [Tetragenococcus koreensis]MCF1622677.1 beta-glucoside-specific P